MLVLMRLRCVIVDDNPDVLQAASDVLEGEGIAVVGMATRSDEAVSLMQAHQPDLMLVDIVMPDGVNGLALARMARLRRRDLKVKRSTGGPSVRAQRSSVRVEPEGRRPTANAARTPSERSASYRRTHGSLT